MGRLGSWNQQRFLSMNQMPTFADHIRALTLRMLKEAGIEVGSIVYEKKIGTHHTKLYDVLEVGLTVRLFPCCTYGDDGKEVCVDAHVLLSEWALTKLEQGGGPYKILSEVAFPCVENAQFHTECRISETHQAIAHIHRGHPCPPFHWYRRPDEVHTSGYVAKGQLVLAPMGPVSNITTKQVSNSISLNNPSAKGSGLSLFMVQLAKPRISKAGVSQVEGQKREDFALVPFWWVWSSTTHVKEEANMSLTWKVYKGIHVPVLENLEALKPKTKLMRYVPNVAKITVMATPEGPPVAKRARGLARAI